MIQGGEGLFYYLLSFIIILIDQLTKWFVVKYMDLYEEIRLIENVFYIKSHRNTGAAFGILEGARWFFILITVIVVVGIVVAIQKSMRESKLIPLALSLILGGAIGNFIDRAMTGEVVDFFYIVLINFPIFNVADMAITFGVGLFIVDAFLSTKKEKAIVSNTEE